MAKSPSRESSHRHLAGEIARILDDCGHSQFQHRRKLKDLAALRSSATTTQFFPAFSRALTPLFDFSRRAPAAERAAKFVSDFAARSASAAGGDADDSFLEHFLRFLLAAASATHRPARLRACQIISEIIMRLPDEAEVSDEIWDEVIDRMKQRVDDKVPAIRAFAVRALSRFANGEDNEDIVELFLHILPQEPNADVRKTVILSLPPCNTTAAVVVDSTLDVSESVRRAAYCVFATKFPLQSLSIRQRTIILQRGLSDRSPSVTRECLKLLKDEWLIKCCNSDPVTLLRFLDVETYESVGEAVMDALLKDGIGRVQGGQTMRQFLTLGSENRETDNFGIQLMEAEVALYWKSVCRHLQNEAHVKGSDAAATTGAEAEVYASEATANNDLLDEILPSTVSDYIELVKAHLSAGPDYRFASRQLLLVGAMLDFSDLTNRNLASAFVQQLLFRPPEHEVDDDGNIAILGDGISLGGDANWARAVSHLARKVHASSGEFEEVLTHVIEELARPCRERTANFIQWIQCLALASFLLENTDTLSKLQRTSMVPSELLHSLLLPGVKQVHVCVQIVAIRCLCHFGLLERRPSEEVVKQLRVSFINGPPIVSLMAGKALFDLAMWHGPHEVDKAIGLDQELSTVEKRDFNIVEFSDINEAKNIGLLELLFSGLTVDWGDTTELDDHETVCGILAEGFAKFLLLSERYSSLQTSVHSLILSRLLNLYFSNEANQRLKQCLSVFFEHYPAISLNHKKCVSRAFIPVMKSMWPGIYGNPGGTSAVVSRMRKRALQVSRFMLHMLQTPIFSREDEAQSSKNTESCPCSTLSLSNFEYGDEGLAISIAHEVASCPDKTSPAGKSYISALCRIAVLLQFRPTEQEAIKCMRRLLGVMDAAVTSDKDLAQELKEMAEKLKSVDQSPDQELSEEDVTNIFRKLGLEGSLPINMPPVLPPTPATRTKRTTATRRRVRRESSSSDEELHSPTAVPMTPTMLQVRSQRASKAAAISKINNSIARTRESDDEDEDDESGVTSSDTSDDSGDELAE